MKQILSFLVAFLFFPFTAQAGDHFLNALETASRPGDYVRVSGGCITAEARDQIYTYSPGDRTAPRVELLKSQGHFLSGVCVGYQPPGLPVLLVGRVKSYPPGYSDAKEPTSLWLARLVASLSNVYIIVNDYNGPHSDEIPKRISL